MKGPHLHFPGEDLDSFDNLFLLEPIESSAISQTTVRQVRKSRPVRDPSQSKAPLVVLFILAKLLEGRKSGCSDTL
jgi:hypothetical protein